MMLGDLGARVIKVETPVTGDDTRRWGPPFVGPADDLQATYFLSCNHKIRSPSPSTGNLTMGALSSGDC